MTNGFFRSELALGEASNFFPMTILDINMQHLMPDLFNKISLPFLVQYEQFISIHEKKKYTHIHPILA